MQSTPSISWILPADINQVTIIDSEHTDKWDESRLRKKLSLPNVIGHALRVNNKIVCFSIYELYKQSIVILKLSTKASSRGNGYARSMMEYIKSKLIKDRNKIIVAIRESDMNGIQFLKHMGFMATGVLKGHFEEQDEDAYRMVYSAIPNNIYTKNSVKQKK